MPQQSKIFFNDIAHKWHHDPARKAQEKLPGIFRQYLTDLGGRILDVGSGAGVLIPIFQSYSGTGSIIELDIAEKMLKESVFLHNRLENTYHVNTYHVNTYHVNASALHVPFKNITFDHIMAFAVYPHLKAPQIALKEFYRLLKPGGSLTILHLMGHKELNQMHRKAHHRVASHHLPPVDIVVDLVKKEGFKPKIFKEQSDLYLIRAIKP